MDCAVCPITLRKALEKLTGVTSTKVDFVTKRPEMVFDAAEAAVDTLIRATADAGYPSHVMQER
jgi:mercuric ion binding protein